MVHCESWETEDFYKALSKNLIDWIHKLGSRKCFEPGQLGYSSAVYEETMMFAHASRLLTDYLIETTDRRRPFAGRYYFPIFCLKITDRIFLDRKDLMDVFQYPVIKNNELDFVAEIPTNHCLCFRTRLKQGDLKHQPRMIVYCSVQPYAKRGRPRFDLSRYGDSRGNVKLDSVPGDYPSKEEVLIK